MPQGLFARFLEVSLGLGVWCPGFRQVASWCRSCQRALFFGGYRGTSLIRNSTPPQDHHRALGIVLLKGPRDALFLMSEVPLYAGAHAVKHLAVGFGFVF